MSSVSRTSLRGLRTFCVAARYESFRAAADALFITPSAVSHQIKNLEEELGAQLFDRNSRDLSLTDAGTALYQQVNPLIEQIDTIIGTIKDTAIVSTIRISVQPFFASEYFVPRLSAFTAAHPQIDIQVGTSDESAEKHPSDADLSIRLFRKPPANLRADLLFPLRTVPAGSPSFKKTLKVENKKIISDFPIIVHETYPQGWQQWSDATGISLPEKTKVTRLDSMIAIVRAVEQGIGAAMVPVPMADLWFTHGSIVRLFDDELVSDASYYLVGDEGAADDSAVALFRDWILENFSEQT